jgi:hypothetical protein
MILANYGETEMDDSCTKNVIFSLRPDHNHPITTS